MIQFIQQNSVWILIIFVGLTLFMGWKIWNDTHVTNVGNRITEHVKDILVENNCKITGNNVRCRKQFADLGTSFTVQQAVDVIVDSFLSHIGISSSSATTPPQVPQPPQPHSAQNQIPPELVPIETKSKGSSIQSVAPSQYNPDRF
jgi:hypothetical protein